MELYQFFAKKNIILSLKANNKFAIIEELVELIGKNYPDVDTGMILKKVIEREKDSSTGIGGGVALPHCIAKIPEKIILALGLKKPGIDFDAIDGKPVSIIILIVANSAYRELYLKLISRLTKILRDKLTVERILNAGSVEDVYRIIINKDRLLSTNHGF